MSDTGTSFLVGDEIGRGSFARVYRARRQADGKEYALKVFPASGQTAEGRRQLLNEAAVLAMLEHPAIVRFKEAFVTSDQQNVCVVMELLEGGTLARFIRHQAAKKSHLPEAAIWRFLLQLATAVRHLHANRVCHRDLKPCNTLFSANGTLKLADFGLSKLMRQKMTSTIVGTPLYAAPEVYNKQPYGFPADIWALGCIAHELATLAPTFESSSSRELRFKVLQGTVPPIPEQYSQDLRDVVAAMLHLDPIQRVTADQLLEMPAVASRLQDMQRCGLLRSEQLGSQGLETQQPQHDATKTAQLLESKCSLEISGLGQLAELLPAARYSGEAAKGTVPPAGPQLATSSAFFNSQTSRQPQATGTGSEEQLQAAALHALSQRSSLGETKPETQPGGGAAISIHVDTRPHGVQPRAPTAAQRAPLGTAGAVADVPMGACKGAQDQNAGSAPSCAPVGPRELAPVQVHPKYAALVAAAGYAAIQPTSPAKAPASPQPGSRSSRAASAPRPGTAGGGGSSSTRMPPSMPAASSRGSMEGSPLVSRRRHEVARAMAAAVSADLAREEALLLGQVAAKLSRTGSAALNSPSLRRALLVAAAVVQQTEETAAALWERPKTEPAASSPSNATTWHIDAEAAIAAAAGAEPQQAPAANAASLPPDGVDAPGPSRVVEQPATPDVDEEAAAEAAPCRPKRRWGLSKLMRRLSALK